VIAPWTKIFARLVVTATSTVETLSLCMASLERMADVAQSLPHYGRKS